MGFPESGIGIGISSSAIGLSRFPTMLLILAKSGSGIGSLEDAEGLGRFKDLILPLFISAKY